MVRTLPGEVYLWVAIHNFRTSVDQKYLFPSGLCSRGELMISGFSKSVKTERCVLYI